MKRSGGNLCFLFRISWRKYGKPVLFVLAICFTATLILSMNESSAKSRVQLIHQLSWNRTHKQAQKNQPYVAEGKSLELNGGYTTTSNDSCMLLSSFQNTKMTDQKQKLNISSMIPLFSKKFSNGFNIRLVHFDLKGAPPNVKYLEEILPILKKFGATGILIEYEDMFPFRGSLSSLSAPNSYCPEDITRIHNLATSLNLEVIPLVQTFGHLEFALKLRQFEKLREANFSPSALCPSNHDSFQLVTTMIDQVVTLHPGIRWLHIGCDEVFHLAICKLCKRFQYKKEILYLNHVTSVAKYVRREYGLIPIIWDDMIRRTSSRVLRDMKIGSLVEPMVWVYAENVESLFFPRMWQRYRTIFKNVWAASAFKGAFGKDLVLPDTLRHLNNHLSWLSVLESENLKTMNFRGLALTGWQRYEHFGPLCELLPVGMPSLFLNLLTIVQFGYSDGLQCEIRRRLGCFNTFEENNCDFSVISDPFLQQTMKSCAYPGAELFHLVNSFRKINESINYYLRDICYKNAENGTNSFLVSTHIHVGYVPKCHSILQNLRDKCYNALLTMSDEITAFEWIEQNISPLFKRLQILDQIFVTNEAFKSNCKGNFGSVKQTRIAPPQSISLQSINQC